MGRQLVYPSRNSSTKDIPDRQPNVAEHTYRFRRVYGTLSAAWAFYLFEIIGIPVGSVGTVPHATEVAGPQFKRPMSTRDLACVARSHYQQLGERPLGRGPHVRDLNHRV